ncbi:MAG: hypothetical protein HWN67_04325 [Candidatus Helarchaeota archaeon]|nr:hypothetical protein [Candidatus Helarchaeota archaeon]
MTRNRGIIGHVEWGDGTPASNLTIELEEKDLIFHDVLPWGETDGQGNFIISYHPEIYGGARRLGEKPDIELLIDYLNDKGEEKTFKKFYKNIKDEWLKVDLKLEDQTGSPSPESKLAFIGICSEMLNLKDSINLDDVESNDIWEACVTTSTAFSRSRYERVMKLTSWGGKVIVGDVIEGPLKRNEKNLNSKGIKSLNNRKNKPKQIKLNFLWLDENKNLIHEINLENQTMNYISEKGLRILLREIDETGKSYKYLPVEQIKITSEIQIKDKNFNFEVVCLESINKLKGLIGIPKL